MSAIELVEKSQMADRPRMKMIFQQPRLTYE